LKCVLHPDREAAGICKLSGKPYCQEDLVELDGCYYFRGLVKPLVANPTRQSEASSVNTSPPASEGTPEPGSRSRSTSDHTHGISSREIGTPSVVCTKTALLLCGLFGFLGVHRFYVGRVVSGLVYAFTFGLYFIGVIVDAAQLLTGSFRDSSGSKLSPLPLSQGLGFLLLPLAFLILALIGFSSLFRHETIAAGILLLFAALLLIPSVWARLSHFAPILRRTDPVFRLSLALCGLMLCVASILPITHTALDPHSEPLRGPDAQDLDVRVPGGDSPQSHEPEIDSDGLLRLVTTQGGHLAEFVRDLAVVDRSGVHKITLDVFLRSRPPVEDVKAIASILRYDALEHVDHVYIFFYLSDMSRDGGAWATAHYTPRLEFEIPGDTAPLAADPDIPTGATIQGIWDDHAMGHYYVMYSRHGRSHIEMRTDHGTLRRWQVSATNSSGITRLIPQASEDGEFFIPTANGHLELWDPYGLVATLTRRR